MSRETGSFKMLVPRPVAVLLVEDDRDHIDLVRSAFHRAAEKYSLQVAVRLSECRQMLEVGHPDILISDFVLPDGRGIELLDSNGAKLSFPVVLMTSRGSEQLAVEVMKAGAIDYVVKSAETLEDMPHIATRALREWRYIQEKKRVEEEREKLIIQLQEALAQIKTLNGMLPICASCKKIRDDQGYWEQVEVYITEHTDAEFSHSICPDCAQKLYPEVFLK
jgi:DNA-binding NtrC family response regulator